MQLRILLPLSLLSNAAASFEVGGEGVCVRHSHGDAAKCRQKASSKCQEMKAEGAFCEGDSEMRCFVRHLEEDELCCLKLACQEEHLASFNIVDRGTNLASFKCGQL